MKPFLGIDLTTNKENEQLNGDEFLIARTSAALTQSLENASEKAEMVVEKANLPLALRVVRWICGIAALILVAGILKSKVSFAEGYQNAPWLFWAAGICAVIWGVLTLVSKRKENTVLTEEVTTQMLSHVEAADAVFTELAVPTDAKEVDVLSFLYKMKDGDIKVCEKPMQMFQYLNPVFRAYTDAENLYLADVEGKYAFPLSDLVSLKTVEKHIRLSNWNKDEDFKSDAYKPYKLTTDSYGSIHCKCYHILEVDRQGQRYGIYIPSYELPVFEELTSLKAE